MPRGLGFFPDAVVIRSGPPIGPAQLYNDEDDDEYRDPNAAQNQYYQPPTSVSQFPAPNTNINPAASGSNTISYTSRQRPFGPTQAPDSWQEYKDWNTNPTGHGGGTRAPPIFVKAQGYDLEATQIEVVVEEAPKVIVQETSNDKEKMSGAGVANWYMSLFTAKPKPKDNPTPATASGSHTPMSTSGVTTRNDATKLPRPQTNPSTSSTSSPTSTSAPQDLSPPVTAPVPARPPVKIPSSEWFIRRALMNKPAEASRSTTPCSIASLVDVDSARTRPPPTPRFRYALGPDNPGFARLEALGWAGGGLGKPESWQGDVFERPERLGSGLGTGSGPASRASTSAPASGEGSDAVVDLTADSADEEVEDEAPVHGPGRTAPVATVLKLDRFGLGRKTGAKKVTHSVREIERAQRRARGVRAPPKDSEALSEKQKLKWKERDRRDREHRGRIAAALNS